MNNFRFWDRDRKVKSVQADLLTRTGTPDDPEDKSYYEELLNKPLFNVPPEIGTPEEKYGEYPPSALGKPEMKDINPHSMEEAEMILPKELEQASEQVADSIAEGVLSSLFGNPIQAYYQLFAYLECGENSDSPIVQRAVKWTRAYINDLPDGAFAIIEPAYASGKVDNKTARHLPHHDKSVSSAEKPTPGGAVDKASIDLPHLRNALARVNQMKPVTDSISSDELQSKASAHLEKHAKALGLGDRDEKEKSSMKVQADCGMELGPQEGPNDPDTFPGSAPAYSYSPPGQKADKAAPSHPETKEQSAPHAEGVTDPLTFPKGAPHEEFSPKSPPGGLDEQAENDPLTFPKSAPAPNYSPPGDKVGGPAGEGPTDPLTFPEGAPHEEFSPPGQKANFGYADDLNVPKGPQSPETERHNPDYDEHAAPPAPWMNQSEGNHTPTPTPGLEHLYGEDDGHLEGVEQFAQEVDLYHKRFMKHAGLNDLKRQAERFRLERDAMNDMTQCAQHGDNHRSYSRELFAYSYGQVRRSLTRALRQFTNKDVEPDTVAYHELLSMKADLLGDSSRKFITNAAKQLPIELANFYGMADDSPNGDDETDDTKDQKKDGGEPEMKETDVKEAVSIAMLLHENGLIANNEGFTNTIVKLAKMSQEGRQDWLEMAQNVTGTPLVSVNEPTNGLVQAGLVGQNSVSAQQANKNLIPVGQRETAGAPRDPRQTARGIGMTGIFAGGRRAPIQG